MKYKTLIIIALLLSACRTPQQIFKTESITKTADTLYIERIPPLHDTLYIPLPAVHTGSAPCDSLCQQQLTDALSASSSSYTSSYKSNLTADNAQPSAPSKQSYKPRKYPYPTPPYTPKYSLQ